MKSSVRNLIQILLIASAIVFALPQSSVAQGQWHKITDREAGFTISFPGGPTYEQSSDPTLLHQTEKYKFFHNGRLLQIVFAPLSRRIRTTADLSDAFSEITRVQAGDGTLLRQMKLPDGGRQYDNVTNDENGTAFHRTRVYMRNGRYYALSYSMYGVNGLDERETQRFFSSFAFMNSSTPKPAAVSRHKPVRRNVDNAKGARWETFNAPDGDFVVEFPGRPQYKEFPNLDTGIPDRKYYYHFGENTFIVSFREEPAAAAARPREVMRQALEQGLGAGGGWHVLQHKRMRDGSHYIESQGIVDGVSTLMFTKIYLRGARLYHVSALTQNFIGPNRNDVVRFLSSFRLL